MSEALDETENDAPPEAEDGADATEPTTLTISVLPPIVHDKVPYDALVLREPRVSEWRKSIEALPSRVTPAAFMESERRLLSIITTWPEGALEELPTSVLERAGRFLRGFEARGRDAVDLGPTLTLTFDPPVEVQRGSFDELNLREPKYGERLRSIRHFDRSDTPAANMAAELSLLNDISGWHPAAVLKMPIGQFARAASFLLSFFPGGRQTGGTSRPS